MSEAAALIVDHHSIRHQSLKSRGTGQKTIESIDPEQAANMSVGSAANLRT
jgi:hypothetical protein